MAIWRPMQSSELEREQTMSSVTRSSRVVCAGMPFTGQRRDQDGMEWSIRVLEKFKALKDQVSPERD